MNVLIIIVNYNGKKLLEKNLSSVVNNNYTTFDIVVVDNNSQDDSVKYIKDSFPNVGIIRNKKNLGFGKANNIAVRECPDYDAYLFLNNDIRVEEDFLTRMVYTMKKDKNIGAVGSKILYSKKENDKFVINSAGVDVTKHYMAYDRYDSLTDSNEYSKVEEVDALCGGCLLVRADAYNKIGGFNEKMFFYYEDIDLSLKLRDSGYDLVYCGKSVVYHDHMATSKKIYYSTKRNS